MSRRRRLSSVVKINRNWTAVHIYWYTIISSLYQHEFLIAYSQSLFQMYLRCYMKGIVLVAVKPINLNHFCISFFLNSHNLMMELDRLYFPETMLVSTSNLLLTGQPLISPHNGRTDRCLTPSSCHMFCSVNYHPALFFTLWITSINRLQPGISGMGRYISQRFAQNCEIDFAVFDAWIKESGISFESSPAI